MSTLSMFAKPGVLLDMMGAHPSEAVGIPRGGDYGKQGSTPMCVWLAVEAAHSGSEFPRDYNRAGI